MSLTQAEIDTITTWVDAGSLEGDRRDLPKAPQFAEGWSIGKPDYIFKMQKPFTVPADGTVPYVYISIPTNLKQDIWIRAVELKPTDRRVVHHIISNLVEGDGTAPDPEPKLTRDPKRKEIGGGLGGLVPGRLYGEFEEGVARKIPAGTDIVLQMHYTTIGQAVTDQTEIGVVLAKEPPAKLRAEGGGSIPNTTFAIPPGDPNYEVTGKLTFDRDTYLSSLYPHMHVRGKDATYTVVYPDGREEVVLRVPKYDFNWQLSYKLAEPKFLPKGSTLKVDDALRQLDGEPLQPRSDGDGALGRSDLGRNDARLLRHDRAAGIDRHTHQSNANHADAKREGTRREIIFFCVVLRAFVVPSGCSRREPMLSFILRSRARASAERRGSVRQPLRVVPCRHRRA